MLAGNVFDGSVLHRLGLQCDATFERKDDLSDFDLLALLYSNFLHYSAHARWNLHHSLVGFEFHDWLAFGNLVPGEIIRRTRSAASMFSPSSGSLNSVAAAYGRGGVVS